MAAITQTVDNFLGGVSKLSDDRKVPGQVTECFNGYPDITVGLTKRPGFKFIEKLKDASGNAFTGTSLDGAKWFFINRDSDTEVYIGCITPKPTGSFGVINIWNAGTGVRCTVNGVDHTATLGIGASPLTGNNNGNSGVTNQTNVAVTTDGLGSGMTVNVTASSGVATALAIHTHGTGYKNGDKITIPANTWSAGSPQADINAIISNYNVPDYLSGNRVNYDVLTVQDTTIITNNLKTVLAEATPTRPPLVTRATFLIDTKPVYNNRLDKAQHDNNIDGGTHNGWKFTYYVDETSDPIVINQQMDGVDSTSGQSYTEGSANWLMAKIGYYIVSGHANSHGMDGLSWTIVNDTLQVDRSATVSGQTRRKYFDLKIENRTIPATVGGDQVLATGADANSQIVSRYEENALTAATLPGSAFHNHYAIVTNTATLDEDDFWVRFVADDEESGEGYWKESRNPEVIEGFQDHTLPHELINTATNVFTFRPISYTKRLAGDDLTNPIPGFVDKKIEKTFYHNNRLGFIAGDNITFSQAGEPFNFFHITARTLSDADPIDLLAQTIRPTSLKNVLPVPQGLMLFAKNQQFLVLGSEDGIMTPKLTSIKPLSNFELNTEIDPIDSGSYFNFITKTPGRSRVFSMVTVDSSRAPKALDISTGISDWIPTTIDTLISSAQAQMLMLSSQSSKDVYVFRTYNNGEKNIMSAWVKWQLPGTVQNLVFDNDDVYAVTKQGSNYTLSIANLSQSPEQAIIVNNNGEKVNPCMDLYKAASSVVWDSANNRSKCYLPYADESDLTPIIVISGDTSGGTFADSGFTIAPERGSDGTGPFFSVPERDLTSIASNVIVGYKYNFDVHLPRVYARINDKSDYTARLNIARMKFAVGLSGIMGFKLKSRGRAEWYTLTPVTEANSYLANDIPLNEQSVFTLPIHQRTENIEVRLFNDSPFPVSLNSMMWEGNYSPRFYRRT
tara:strand:- start:1580 stop:4459 length:2880 start_codon:yes stop_codon:yes gene_type:complete